MKELGKWDLGGLKNGVYWVYCGVVKKIIMAELNGGVFYYYNEFHPYEIIVTRVTHYKKIVKPKM